MFYHMNFNKSVESLIVNMMAIIIIVVTLLENVTIS